MSGLKHTRIAVCGIAIAAMAVLIGGCSSSSSSSSSPSAASTSGASAAATGSGTRMAIFYYNPSPYGIASLNGAKQEAAKLGIQLDAFDANNNPQLQSTQIQDAITTGKYKAFWVWGLNDPALTPVINSAIAAGIKIASADYTWGTLDQQNTMNAACQKQVGSGHCNIAFLPGLSNFPTDTVRINQMTAYYNAKPNYTFTVMPPGMYDQTTSQNVAQTFFTAH